MIDRIVPATTPELIDRLRSEKGIDDPAAVFHEPFRQWVIKDQFVDDERPDLEAVGVQIVDNVEPFEQMKLRMLNGTHSALAYIGSLAGYETVADAMGDQTVAELLENMWHDEIIPTLVPPLSVDPRRYTGRLAERYRNPEIHHLLEQIAMDGSKKLPQRILDPLFENLAAGRSYDKLLTVVAAWARFLQSRAKIGRINDPLAEKLVSIVQNARGDAQLVASLLVSEKCLPVTSLTQSRKKWSNGWAHSLPIPPTQIEDRTHERDLALVWGNLRQDHPRGDPPDRGERHCYRAPRYAIIDPWSVFHGLRPMGRQTPDH